MNPFYSITVSADPEVQMDGLATLRQDVNNIGKELSTLEAERNSLASWEVEALDRATSLMRNVAVSAEKGIATFRSDRTHLWATSYPADMAKAAEDADQVKTILSAYLKLAKMREREAHLERDPSIAPQF